MQLSTKRKTFSRCFAAFLKFIFHFKYFAKKDAFPKLETAKDVVTQMSKKSRFRTPCDSQHVNSSQTLVKSA